MFLQPKVKQKSNKVMCALLEVQSQVLTPGTDVITKVSFQLVVLASQLQTILSTPSQSTK